MLANFFIDDYSYQENLLTKYHKKLGYDVEVVASLFNFDENGEGYFEKGRREYLNENQIPVTRLEYKKGPWNKKLRQYRGTYEALDQANPDIIFIHGCQFLDIKVIVKYLEKNSQVKVYVDNHADFSNSATNWLSKKILHGKIWKSCAQLIEPFAEKFYGVLPARVDFLERIYGVPEKKTELLVMGADNEKVQEANSLSVIEKVREKLGVKPNDFLIVTGGKIDHAKLQVINLMKVVVELKITNVKLVVYGSVIPEMQEEVNKFAESKSIEYIGWLTDEQSYKLFSAADLVVFPGRHSVYWEQVVAMGTPMVVKFWDGTDHIDIGDNCKFLYKDTEEELSNVLKNIIENRNVYNSMLENAQSNKKNQFLYTNIAKRSIDLVN